MVGFTRQRDTATAGTGHRHRRHLVQRGGTTKILSSRLKLTCVQDVRPSSTLSSFMVQYTILLLPFPDLLRVSEEAPPRPSAALSSRMGGLVKVPAVTCSFDKRRWWRAERVIQPVQLIYPARHGHTQGRLSSL